MFIQLCLIVNTHKSLEWEKNWFRVWEKNYALLKKEEEFVEYNKI